VDVLIIGGGIAGMTLLFQLIQSGVSNAYLVEESSVGFHASGRNGGQIMLRGSQLFSQIKNGDIYLDFVAENNRRFLNGLRSIGFDSDLRDAGGLRLAIDDDELNLLKQEADLINSGRDIHCPILTADQVKSLLPKTGFAGGMYVPTEATFNPYKVVNGLREVIDKKGRRVLTDARVSNVSRNNDGSFAVSIHHKGTIRAKKLVYCLNTYTPELIPELANIFTSYRGQMVATDFLPDAVVQTLPQMSMSCHDGNEYWRLHGGRLLVGGMRHAVRGNQVGIIDDGEVSPAVNERLRGFVKDALPIPDVKFTHTWSGIMCSTPDDMPLIGALFDRPDEYILAGFNGYGYSHVLYGSMLIRDLIKSGESDNPGVELFDPKRFF
jgi:glycine/D-amino acid oxidase-like deaminating enzyme